MLVRRRFWLQVLRALALNALSVAWVLLMAAGDWHRTLIGLAFLGLFDAFAVGVWAGFVSADDSGIVIWFRRPTLSAHLGL